MTKREQSALSLSYIIGVARGKGARRKKIHPICRARSQTRAPSEFGPLGLGEVPVSPNTYSAAGEHRAGSEARSPHKMGPRRSSNYGTFVAPPGCCTEEAYRDGGNPAGVGHSEIAPAFSTHTVEYHILTLGLRLMKQGAEVVISEMDDDVARVRIGLAFQRWIDFYDCTLYRSLCVSSKVYL